jgi:hypothetical protein
MEDLVTESNNVPESSVDSISESDSAPDNSRDSITIWTSSPASGKEASTESNLSKNLKNDSSKEELKLSENPNPYSIRIMIPDVNNAETGASEIKKPPILSAGSSEAHSDMCSHSSENLIGGKGRIKMLNRDMQIKELLRYPEFINLFDKYIPGYRKREGLGNVYGNRLSSFFET